MRSLCRRIPTHRIVCVRPPTTRSRRPFRQRRRDRCRFRSPHRRLILTPRRNRIRIRLRNNILMSRRAKPRTAHRCPIPTPRRRAILIPRRSRPPPASTRPRSPIRMVLRSISRMVRHNSSLPARFRSFRRVRRSNSSTQHRRRRVPRRRLVRRRSAHRAMTDRRCINNLFHNNRFHNNRTGNRSAGSRWAAPPLLSRPAFGRRRSHNRSRKRRVASLLGRRHRCRPTLHVPERPSSRMHGAKPARRTARVARISPRP